MQDQLASRYYIIIYIDSVTKMDGLTISWFLSFAKNFLEEDFSSYLNLETLFQVYLSLLVVKQIELLK